MLRAAQQALDAGLNRYTRTWGHPTLRRELPAFLERHWGLRYDRHVAPASLPGLADRTVTIASLSKTYAVTGWGVGYAAAPRALMLAIRTVHDFLTVCAPAPLRAALQEALLLPESFYEQTRAAYLSRHRLLSEGLSRAGWVGMMAGGRGGQP